MARYKKKLEDDIRCPLEYGLAMFGCNVERLDRRWNY